MMSKFQNQYDRLDSGIFEKRKKDTSSVTFQMQIIFKNMSSDVLNAKKKKKKEWNCLFKLLSLFCLNKTKKSKFFFRNLLMTYQ